MAYRDDLEAAHARIAALEAQLAGVGIEVGGVAATLAKTADLERAVIRVRDEMRQITERQHDITARIRVVTEVAEIPSLTAHNRARGELGVGTPAGVACPMCLVLAGDTIEMHEGSASKMRIVVAGKTGVVCPRCDYSAFKRD